LTRVDGAPLISRREVRDEHKFVDALGGTRYYGQQEAFA
jgi:hypothetical protein